MFLEYNQSYLSSCNSAPFCSRSSLCCVSPDRHRVFSRVLWQSMSPSLAISCFLSEQHSSCSLLQSHYLGLMVSCHCMISSRPGWSTGTFLHYVLYFMLYGFASSFFGTCRTLFILMGKFFHYYQEWILTGVREGKYKRNRGHHCRQRNTTQRPWCEWGVVGCLFVKYCSEVLKNDKITTVLWCMASSFLQIAFTVFPVRSLTL